MMTHTTSVLHRRVGAAAFLLVLLALLTGCDNEQARFPDRDNFTATVNDYLAQRGHAPDRTNPMRSRCPCSRSWAW